ncbi:MAG: HD domain-containing phosphohydrolase [Nitrospirota bacterium]
MNTHTPKSKLAIFIAIFGWLIPVVFLAHEKFAFGELVRHLIHPDSIYERLAHVIFIFIVPPVFTFTGHLINERFKLLKSVKESEEKYLDLYENAPDGYHSCGPDGLILEVNNTWLKMLGYERDEVVGKMNFTDLLTENAEQAFRSAFAELKEQGFLLNKQRDLKRKDGALLPVIVNSTAIYDEKSNFLKSRSIIRNISSRKKYEEMLKHAADEWRQTFDSMPYGVILLDMDLNIIRTNEYFSKLIEKPFNEIIGKKCCELLSGMGKPLDGCLLPKMIKISSAEPFEFYDARLNKYFMGYLRAMNIEKNLTKTYIVSLVDISEIKNKENRLIKSRDAFINMLKDIDFSYKELREIYDGLIISFVNALDAKSTWTKGHSTRVTEYAVKIAKEIGLPEYNIEILNTAALLHDIGKIGTYDTVLDKPGRLTEDEFALVKMHPNRGAEILRPIRQFKPIIPIIKHHHERIDGKGYPDGLKGEDIPFMARILHVADSFDSMTADRPYRPAPGIEYAVSELKKYSGTQFDPKVVEAFLRVIEKME